MMNKQENTADLDSELIFADANQKDAGDARWREKGRENEESENEIRNPKKPGAKCDGKISKYRKQ